MYSYRELVRTTVLSCLGNKMNNVDVVYTMWGNLKKNAGMDVGQVGFHKQREVEHVYFAFYARTRIHVHCHI